MMYSLYQLDQNLTCKILANWMNLSLIHGMFQLKVFLRYQCIAAILVFIPNWIYSHLL